MDLPFCCFPIMFLYNCCPIVSDENFLYCVSKASVATPTWFNKPFQMPESFRRDWYICTRCAGQSCGGVYASTCPKCKGIITNPPRGDRADYLCYECITAQRQHFCKCEYPRPRISLVTHEKKPSDPCCCGCKWCNCICRCVCCCLDCKWMTSSCRTCCISRCSCSYYKCYWSWCGSETETESNIRRFGSVRFDSVESNRVEFRF